MTINPASLIRIYSFLLRLYPSGFQNEFAAEMESVFVTRLEEAAVEQSTSIAAICLRELLDLPINLFREHMATWDKKNTMQNIFPNNPNRLIWIGGLAFGLAHGLGFAIALFCGILATPYVEYTAWTLLFFVVLKLVETGIAAAVLWYSVPGLKGRWGFLPAVLAAGLLYGVMTGIWVRTAQYSNMNTQLGYAYWGYIGPLLQAVLWGALFAACLGWIIEGRAAILKYALIGAAAEGIGFSLQVFNTYLNYQVLNLQMDLNSYQSYPGYVTWLILLRVMQGFILGVLLGWAMTRSSQRSNLSPNSI